MKTLQMDNFQIFHDLRKVEEKMKEGLKNFPLKLVMLNIKNLTPIKTVSQSTSQKI